MKMIYYPLNLEYTFVLDKTNMLFIENPRELENFAINIKEKTECQNDDIAFLDNNYDDIRAKKIDIITSPFELNLDKKKIQKRLFAELNEDLMMTELEEKYVDLLKKIVDFLEELSLESSYDITYGDNFSLDVILKAFDVHLRSNGGCFIERLIEYAKLSNIFLGKRIFVLISVSCYLGKEDFEYLRKFSQYEEMYFIFIEGAVQNLKNEVNKHIIDVDLCEIY